MSRAIGLGCMRLSTEPTRPDDAAARAIVDAAIDAGVTLVDTADVYCHSDADLGHNERLLAHVPAHVRIVTKGGLTRPDGAWVPNGRARHLAAAARASLARLGRIDLYLLHALDPKVPLATSIRALAKLVDDRIVPAIGLSNVNLTQLESALAILDGADAPSVVDGHAEPTRAHATIAAVEIELHPYKLDALRGGLVEACTSRGIEVLAHRPLGGPRGVARLSRDAIVKAHAARQSCTPAELILGWLRTLSPMVVPLPGASRMETARSAAHIVELDADTKHALDEHFVRVGAPTSTSPARAASSATSSSPTAASNATAASTSSNATAASTSSSSAAAANATAALAADEVVLVIGIPGAGKSTLAKDLVARGYTRLNRDDRGGSLLELARALDAGLATGVRRAVLDNTYPSRASRRPVIEIAHRHGLAVRCIVVETPLERAQHNAVARLLDKHGRLLEPAELRGADIGPGAQFRWRREYEPPREDEGFDAIEVVPFARIEQTSDALEVHDARTAILVELDDLVWRGRPRTVEKVALHEGARDALAAWHRAGYAIAVTSWQPQVAPTRFAELVETLARLLDVPLLASACFHIAGPPVCWCRKPLPGLALAMARHHGLRYALCVGGGAADKGFAARAGLPYHDVREGWPRPPEASGTMDS